MQTPVSIYVVHHPQCVSAQGLAKSLYDWFRLGYLSGDASGAGLPVYYRRQLNAQGRLQPAIDFAGATLNVVILLVDQKLVVDEKWRAAAVDMADLKSCWDWCIAKLLWAWKRTIANVRNSAILRGCQMLGRLHLCDMN